MQLISGMNLKGYWLANMMSDIVKCYVPIILILACMFVFEANQPGVWVLFVLWPWAVVPFSYVTSFLLTSDTVAQIVTLFMHFLFAGVLALTVYSCQTAEPTAKLGDSLRWWACLVPSYPVTHAVLFGSLGDTLSEVREKHRFLKHHLPEISADPWVFQNLAGDTTVLILHFIIGTLMLILIEADVFKKLKKFTFKKVPERKQNMVLDEDVLTEEERVRKQCQDEEARIHQILEDQQNSTED